MSRARVDRRRRAARDRRRRAARAQRPPRRLRGLEHARRRDRRRRRRPARRAARARSRRRPGCVVREWSGPLYEVQRRTRPTWVGACAARCTSRSRSRATLRVDDPDGIVVEAAFVPPHRVRRAARVVRAVGARAAARVAARTVGAATRRRGFHYEVHGTVARLDARGHAVTHVSAGDARPTRRSCTSISTRSTRRSSSSTTRRCAASPVDRRRARQPRRRVAPRATRRARFGVHSAMPMARARRACPHGGVPLAPLRRATPRRAAR